VTKLLPASVLSLKRRTTDGLTDIGNVEPTHIWPFRQTTNRIYAVCDWLLEKHKPSTPATCVGMMTNLL